MFVEKIVIGEKFPLDGLLTIPEKGNTPYPAIVLVHGSGPNDMDEKVGNCYTFKDLAKGFAERGIATIRYNKRTKTYGKEMVKGADGPNLTVWDETIEDAIFATELMKKDPRINPEKMFIAGHSMGAMLAPRIDAEGGNYTGLILLAGSPRKLEEIIIEQSDNSIALLNPFLRWIANMQIKKLKSKLSGIYELSDEEAKKKSFLGKYMKVYYFKEWGLKPAEGYLKALTKPIYVTQGDMDFHVSVENDFMKYKEILADHPNATFKLYPNLNHLFMPTVYGLDITKGVKEYRKPQHVEEYVMDDIAEWIAGI
ncbi:MAG: alpha/beta hydrolase [Oscillospiraceae bacterium]|nr:alpha/beta hydrolase [Oscillospiraceae bacterium]